MSDVSSGKWMLYLPARGAFPCASVYAKPFAPVSAASPQRLARRGRLEEIAEAKGRTFPARWLALRSTGLERCSCGLCGNWTEMLVPSYCFRLSWVREQGKRRGEVDEHVCGCRASLGRGRLPQAGCGSAEPCAPAVLIDNRCYFTSWPQNPVSAASFSG